jgi:hypothetical protein
MNTLFILLADWLVILFFFTGKTWSTHDVCDVISKGLHAALQRPGSFNLLDEIYSFFSKNSQCSVPDVKQLLSQGP